jgi:hypothetical protein
MFGLGLHSNIILKLTDLRNRNIVMNCCNREITEVGCRLKLRYKVRKEMVQDVLLEGVVVQMVKTSTDTDPEGS